MNQNQFNPPATQALSLLFCLFLLFACTPETSPPQNQYCLNENGTCFDLDQGVLKIILSQPLKIEQPIKFKIEFPKHWKINQTTAQLVGADMYMGKIPVMLTQSTADPLLEGELLIIACTRPNMVWHLELEVELQDGQFIHAHWPFLMTNTE
ncbi:hypothetical protein K0504_10705 [Neiella marina]|uniref:Lipoprotein n=1 Tax=Neiella holothuriorum TaxID=2870530 RepID=A0ABS7EGP1_9GAMM|nr:hypothetical protein [Neiella holothuriorum]MBW8191507.1 hypothetical protein [Neiella holothuriorum]